MGFEGDEWKEDKDSMTYDPVCNEYASFVYQVSNSLKILGSVHPEPLEEPEEDDEEETGEVIEDVRDELKGFKNDLADTLDEIRDMCASAAEAAKKVKPKVEPVQASKPVRVFKEEPTPTENSNDTQKQLRDELKSVVKMWKSRLIKLEKKSPVMKLTPGEE